MNYDEILEYDGEKGGKEDYGANLILGTMGQGKSTLAKVLIRNYLATFTPHFEPHGIYPRCFVHDFNGGLAFEKIPTIEQYLAALNNRRKKNGKSQIELENPWDVFGAKFANGKLIWDRGPLRYVCGDRQKIAKMHMNYREYFRNGIGIFDEVTNYMYAGVQDWQVEILNNVRHTYSYVYYIFHGLRDVPPRFSRSSKIKKIYLFKTGEQKTFSEKNVQDRYPTCGNLLIEALNTLEKLPKSDHWIQPYALINIPKQEFQIVKTTK